MSVKGKVKRLNRHIEDLNDQIEDLEYARFLEQFRYKRERKELENLIMFFVTNQVDKPAEGGVQIDRFHVEKFENLDVDIWYEVENDAYVIKFKEEDNERSE